MQYSIYVNQFFVANHPECGDLDFTDLAIFDCIRKMIAANWAKKEIVDGILWSNISVKKVMDEMPMLRTSRDKPMKYLTIHRRITKLCEAGLLQRGDDNKKKSTSFLALGNIAADYDSFKEPLSKTIKPFIENDKAPLSNLIKNHNTIQNTLSNSSDTDSPREPEVKEKVVRKAKPTRAEVISFYENEKRNSLEAKLPPKLIAAAAPWKMTNEQLMSKLVAGYEEIVDYMMNPSDMWPQGMWRCVLTKPNQLNFLQFCTLILEYGMSRAELKKNLNSWENRKYDNDNLYATLYSWKNKESNQPSKGMNGDFPKKGFLSNPTQVHQ